MSQNYTISGIDVAKWQGDVDWNEVYKAGFKFGIAKCTEGADYLALESRIVSSSLNFDEDSVRRMQIAFVSGTGQQNGLYSIWVHESIRSQHRSCVSIGKRCGCSSDTGGVAQARIHPLSLVTGSFRPSATALNRRWRRQSLRREHAQEIKWATQAFLGPIVQRFGLDALPEFPQRQIFIAC